MSHYFGRLAQRTGITNKGAREKQGSAANSLGTAGKEQTNLGNILEVHVEKVAELINSPAIDNLESLQNENKGIRRVESVSLQKEYEGSRNADASRSHDDSFEPTDTEHISKTDPQERKETNLRESFESKDHASIQEKNFASEEDPTRMDIDTVATKDLKEAAPSKKPIQVDRANLMNKETKSSRKEITYQNIDQIREKFIEKEIVNEELPEFQIREGNDEESLSEDPKVTNRPDISERNILSDHNQKHFINEVLHRPTFIEKSEMKMPSVDSRNINVRIGKISVEVYQTLPKPRLISKPRSVSKTSVAKTQATRLSRYYLRGL